MVVTSVDGSIYGSKWWWMAVGSEHMKLCCFAQLIAAHRVSGEKCVVAYIVGFASIAHQMMATW
jgi:hypothetical protein